MSPGLPDVAGKRWTSSLLAQSRWHKVPAHLSAMSITIWDKSCISVAFAELLPSSQHCLWDWQSGSWLILQLLSQHRMQEKLSNTIEDFCCLRIKHGLMAFDVRKGGKEDSEALNQMLQLFPCFSSKDVNNVDGAY